MVQEVSQLLNKKSEEFNLTFSKGGQKQIKFFNNGTENDREDDEAKEQTFRQD